MVNKNYKQHMKDFDDGLIRITRNIKESKNRIECDKLIKAKIIQEARIEGFKLGYKLCRKDLGGQIELT